MTIDLVSTKQTSLVDADISMDIYNGPYLKEAKAMYELLTNLKTAKKPLAIKETALSIIVRRVELESVEDPTIYPEKKYRVWFSGIIR